MAHFAKIDENNIVIAVLTLDDENCRDENNNEVESIGQAYLQENNNWPAHLWIKASYNTHNGKYLNADGTEHPDQSKAFRGNYPGIGNIWDPTNQIFLPTKPYPSWIVNVAGAKWQSPIGDAPALTDEQVSQYRAGTHNWYYQWDEDNQVWNLTDLNN